MSGYLPYDARHGYMATTRNGRARAVLTYPDYVRECNPNLESTILLNEQCRNRFVEEERLRQSITKHATRKESF